MSKQTTDKNERDPYPPRGYKQMPDGAVTRCMTCERMVMWYRVIRAGAGKPGGKTCLRCDPRRQTAWQGNAWRVWALFDAGADIARAIAYLEEACAVSDADIGGGFAVPRTDDLCQSQIVALRLIAILTDRLIDARGVMSARHGGLTAYIPADQANEVDILCCQIEHICTLAGFYTQAGEEREKR